MFQVSLSIELNDSQLNEFERMIPIQLAEPPWNYTEPLNKGIMVHAIAIFKLMYAAPSWFGYISVEQLNIIRKLFVKARIVGSY